MAVENYPIVFEQGTPFQLVFTWTDSNNNPVDLTGYSARLHVVTDLVNRVPLLLFTTGSGATPNTSIVTGNTAGTVTVGATDAATTAMNFDTGYYSLLVQSPGGVVTKLLEGNVTVAAGLSW
jgi:hypothetical protein